jgi:BlaI family penicillinase repressor
MLYIKEKTPMTNKLSDAEFEIMKIIWENAEETTLFSYLMEELAAQGKPCQKNTLIVLLSRLVSKGYLSATKIGRRNEYVPLISEQAYQTAQTQHFIDKVYEGSVKGLVTNLIAGDLLMEEEYEELKKLLEGGRRG